MAWRCWDRSGKHPEEHLAGYAGLMQADAYSGFNRLYEASRRPGPIIEASCWAHARRKFFDLARINKAPIAIEAVERIDALFAIERAINGALPHERCRVRNERSRPLVTALETWLREQRRKLSARNEIAKAIQYSLGRWSALTRFLDDGRLCMSQQRRRGGAARHRGRPQKLDLRRIRRRRPARHRHLHADRERQAQRHRSAGLAR
jgi:transposase